MIALTLAEIAAITAGAVTDPAAVALEVTGAAFLDSRDPVPGGLFVALPGENADGHDYAAGAVAGGAAAMLGSRDVGVPGVLVDDVEAALQQLAAEVLRRLRGGGSDLRVIALTGSQGKTSTKDMLAAVLASAGETVATYGSFNNELGLPLTVLRAEPGTRFLVLEMGARGIGHLARLCEIAPPDVALVLNVGSAHLGEFGSREAIARAKGEIVDALGPDGIAVLNLDDPLVAAMAPRSRGRVQTFGRAAGALVRLEEVTVDDLGRPSFDLQQARERIHVRLGLLGEHQASNAAAVAAVAAALGLGLDRIGQSLAGIRALSKWRMELHERADGVAVINDAYNANPESMRSALQTLAGIGRRTGRRTVAVLGEMRELGAVAADEHRELGRLAVELGIDQVLVVGEAAREIGVGDDTAAFVPDVDAAAAWVRENVSGSDVVLVKASRAAGLERVAQAVLDSETGTGEGGTA